mgnify:CR=1 FL=1
MILLNKDLKLVATATWDGHFPKDQVSYFFQITMKVLQKHPVDMLVFEHVNNKLHVRLAGYELENDTSVLDETTVVYTEDTKPFKTFWFKVDLQEDFYLGTFLFPEDY